MYHTEGFVNKYTIDSKKHIITLALKKDGRSWYVWCIIKKAVVETNMFRQVLSFWLQQTLLTRGNQSIAYVQRELNRLGGYLQNMKSSHIELQNVELLMFYEGEFYHWDDEDIGLKKGVYKELSKGFYGYVSEEGLWNVYRGDEESVEETANRMELSLLEACQNGETEEGFFLIWEDDGAF